MTLISMILIAVLISHNQGACSPGGNILATNNVTRSVFEEIRILFNRPLFSSYYVQSYVLQAREDI